MGHDLNSLKGVCIGDYIGDIKGDTRSLEYSTCGVPCLLVWEMERLSSTALLSWPCSPKPYLDPHKSMQNNGLYGCYQGFGAMILHTFGV